MKHLTLQDLIERAEIHDVLMRYTHSMDRLNDKMLRSVFWPDAVVVFPDAVYQGSAEGFLKFLSHELRTFERTQHFVGNTTIEVDGDFAYVEAYLMANHRATMEHKWKGRHVTLWGRYIQRYERRNGMWKIAQHQLLLDWQRDDTAGGWYELPIEQLGSRDRTDPSETHTNFKTTQAGEHKNG